MTAVLTGDEVFFERDAHAYLDQDGKRCMSITQAIKIAGLIDYSMVAPDVLEFARWRGQMVHQACAVIDRRESLDDYDVPLDCTPYIKAWIQFCVDMGFVPDPEWVERPIIATLFGHRVGTTPDVIGGMVRGVLAVVERKATAAAHPSWSIQTAGQAMALRAAGLQIRARLAVQLFKTGKYRLHTHEDKGDFDTFADVYRVAAWKLKHNLATLA